MFHTSCRDPCVVVNVDVAGSYLYVNHFERLFLWKDSLVDVSQRGPPKLENPIVHCVDVCRLTPLLVLRRPATSQHTSCLLFRQGLAFHTGSKQVLNQLRPRVLICHGDADPFVSVEGLRAPGRSVRGARK